MIPTPEWLQRRENALENSSLRETRITFTLHP